MKVLISELFDFVSQPTHPSSSFTRVAQARDFMKERLNRGDKQIPCKCNIYMLSRQKQTTIIIIIDNIQR